ncbi:MAG: undecaprenyldiphospho-muramoylpentapeptide beta-N-acetylglucosaminyltransferase [Gammaproteobacteria bacterium]|nr:MAG: undecaprenyldiphospho-muramoylpentapeptide beta-N-acetylglucosaminyltransferase [Gammaproteobacteria bacterium]
METKKITVMIMAGGTGGHVFPGLAVAKELRHRGAEVFWLGTRKGLEARTVPVAGFDIEWISIQGLRGKGVLGWLLMPWRLLRALMQSLKIIRRRRPSVVVSFGGFVAGPGALMARLLRRPLIVHEQNAIPGLTNKILSFFADKVLCGFPGAFGNQSGAIHVGNPVRDEIIQLHKKTGHLFDGKRKMRLLIIGGSLGAKVFNETVPLALRSIDESCRPEIWHQSGRGNEQDTRDRYEPRRADVKVTEFIDDIAQAYKWADVVLCRAGAMTVSELAVAGRPAILVPYPYAVDDHQTANAHYLSDRDGAILIAQKEFTPERLQDLLQTLQANPKLVRQMAKRSRSCGVTDATETVSQYCLEVCHA